MKDLKSIEKELKNAINKAAKSAALADIEKKFLGKKGELTLFLRSLKDFSDNERKEFGKKANQLKKEITGIIKEKKEELSKKDIQKNLEKEKIDVSRPAYKDLIGHAHPLGQVAKEASEIFRQMGFSVVQGPEVETEWNNFDALNIPKNHPARDLWDTFWLRSNQKNSKFSNKSQKLLLRTHTSPVQIRYMKENQPPFRIISPGKVFRHETTDAGHDIEFYQLEGLMVDKNVSIANFKHVIQTFFKRFFRKDVEIRLRPSFFPFVEPGFEVDITCTACRKSQDTKNKFQTNPKSQIPKSKTKNRCSVCKGMGWIEIAGAGMVHPKVFENAGHNPRHLQGFAFGFGIDRLAMMKYKIPDIRLFHSTDPRFLKQF